MARTLTKKQKAWADKKLETGNGTQAALEVYDTNDENTAAVIASENLTKPKIQEYLQSKAEDAITRIEKLAINAKSESVRLAANIDLADRGGLKPVQKHLNVNLDVTADDAALEEAAKLYGERALKNRLS